MKTKLIFTVSLDVEENEISEIREISRTILQILGEEQTTVKLVRKEDRSGKNLLLPKLEGRTGEHYQSRGATIDDFR